MNPNLKHLYISPSEACNLRCQMCYTTKTVGRLQNSHILGFINRYHQVVDLETVTFCGGETFLLIDFPSLVNTCTSQGLFVQIITNGTLDRLTQFTHPNSINLIVSIDGLPAYHDKNRGAGNWHRSLTFLKHARSLGFHLEIFSIITQENLDHTSTFEQILAQEIGETVPVTYHPRKPLAYLAAHPTSHQCPTTHHFSFISVKQHQQLGQSKSIFPPPDLGCYQPSLMSDGQIYACCEGIEPIGDINTDISVLIANLNQRINPKLQCVEPNFICGLKELYPHVA